MRPSDTNILPRSSDREWFRVVLPLIMITITSGVFVIFIRIIDLDGDSRMSLLSLMNGTAHKPFVYRMLLPLMVKLFASIITLEPSYIAFSIMYLCLIGYVISFYHLSIHFFPDSFFAYVAASLSPLFLFPFFFQGKIYDFSVLFLWTLEFALLARSKFWWYLIVYPFACLNKETTLLLTIFFAVHYYRILIFDVYIRLLSIQLAIYALIRGFLFFLYQNNPGGEVEFHLYDHIRAISRYPMLNILIIFMIGVSLILIFYRWKEKPLFLRNGFITIGLPLIVLFYLYGSPFEFRVFYELFPIALLLSLFSLVYLFGYFRFKRQSVRADGVSDP